MSVQPGPQATPFLKSKVKSKNSKMTCMDALYSIEIMDL